MEYSEVFNKRNDEDKINFLKDLIDHEIRVLEMAEEVNNVSLANDTKEKILMIEEDIKKIKLKGE